MRLRAGPRGEGCGTHQEVGVTVKPQSDPPCSGSARRGSCLQRVVTAGAENSASEVSSSEVSISRELCRVSCQFCRNGVRSTAPIGFSRLPAVPTRRLTTSGAAVRSVAPRRTMILNRDRKLPVLKFPTWMFSKWKFPTRAGAELAMVNCILAAS